MTTSTEKKGIIFQKIPAIMSEIPSIGKDRKNTGQGYNFRGIDDVYNLIQPVMAKHGVFMSAEILDDRHEERQSKSGSAVMYRVLKMRYSFVASDGSFVSTDAVGEGMDSGDKASAKAMSIAQKYAILQLFLVPTADAKDPEEDNHEVAPKPKPARVAPAPLTEIQRLTIAKLVDDMQSAGKDPEAAIAKVRDYYSEKGVTIDNFPADLTFEQAESVIKAWSAKMKKAEAKK